jgi:hypothetical protein
VRDTEQIVLPATDWSAVPVSRMWELIKDHDADAATKQSAGWSLAFELLDHHHRRLEEYRDMLAARWRGPAADAFLARVDGLLASLSDTRRVALTNDPVLPHLSASLTEAKAKLEPVKRQWEANQAKLAAATQASPAMQKVSDLVGSYDSTRAQQAQLHAQAVGIMTTLAQHTTEGYKALTMPTPYEAGLWRDPGTPDPRPTHGGSAGSGGSSSVVVSSGIGARHDAAPVPVGGSPGSPVLSGGPVVPPPLAGPGPGGGWPPATPGGPGMPPVIGPVVGAVPPGASGRSTAGGGSQWLTPGRRGLPPGGVINAPPESTVEPARPAAGGARANRVGGIIGPTTGRETEGMFAPPVGGAGGGRSTGQRRTNPDYHTDEHWPTPKGVPPVLGATEPEPEPTHDPGMPVIGMDTPPRGRRDR